MSVKVIPITPAYRDNWEKIFKKDYASKRGKGGTTSGRPDPQEVAAYIHPDYCANPLPLAHPVWMFRREDLR